VRGFTAHSPDRCNFRPRLVGRPDKAQLLPAGGQPPPRTAQTSPSDGREAENRTGPSRSMVLRRVSDIRPSNDSNLPLANFEADANDANLVMTDSGVPVRECECFMFQSPVWHFPKLAVTAICRAALVSRHCRSAGHIDRRRIYTARNFGRGRVRSKLMALLTENLQSESCNRRVSVSEQMDVLDRKIMLEGLFQDVRSSPTLGFGAGDVRRFQEIS